MIRSLNPIYRRDIVPGLTKPAPLRLPVNEVARFIDMEDSIYAMAGNQVIKRAEVEVVERPVAQQTTRQRTTTTRRNTTNNSASYVTVKRGDTLGALARRNHTTVARIKQLNGMRSDVIQAGKRLRVR